MTTFPNRGLKRHILRTKCFNLSYKLYSFDLFQLGMNHTLKSC